LPAAPIPPPLFPGERLGKLVLPEPDGRLLDFTHQTVAGSTLVLRLVEGAPSPAVVGEIARLGEPLGTVEASAYLVAPLPPERAQTIVLPPGVRLVLDPERRFARAVGLGQSGAVIIAPDGRIAAVLAEEETGRIPELCQTIFERSEPRVIRRGAPALIIPGVLEIPLCRRLLDYWHQGQKLDNLVATGRAGQDTGAEPVKRRTDVVLQDRELLEIVRTRMQKRVLPEIRKAFAFEVARFEALRLGCYDAASGGWFRRHRDNSTPYTQHRRFAMTLNLNTGAYEGGELRFPEYGRELYRPEAGGAVIFSCSLLHEALPVTRGKRFAMFTFLSDAAGAAREQELIRKEQAAGRKGFELR
jgi:predicted 2-oxoglutarate/Fe(II)-dependent dioxygenase YbiX